MKINREIISLIIMSGASFCATPLVAMTALASKASLMRPALHSIYRAALPVCYVSTKAALSKEVAEKKPRAPKVPKGQTAQAILAAAPQALTSHRPTIVSQSRSFEDIRATFKAAIVQNQSANKENGRTVAKKLMTEYAEAVKIDEFNECVLKSSLEVALPQLSMNDFSMQEALVNARAHNRVFHNVGPVALKLGITNSAAYQLLYKITRDHDITAVKEYTALAYKKDFHYSPEELVKSIQSFAPSWDNIDEDLTAMILKETKEKYEKKDYVKNVFDFLSRSKLLLGLIGLDKLTSLKLPEYKDTDQTEYHLLLS